MRTVHKARRMLPWRPWLERQPDSSRDHHPCSLTRSVSRLIAVAEKVRGVDERRVRDRSHHRDRDRLLLNRLRAHRRSPPKDDRVHAIGADGEDAWGQSWPRLGDDQDSHIATYRVAVLSVAGARAKPKIANALQPVICHVLSLYFPEVRDTTKVKMPAIR